MNTVRHKLLYVHSSSELWGSDRCLCGMLELIDKDRYEPSVVLPRPGPLSRRIEALGMEVIYPPCMGILHRFRNPVQCVAYFVKLMIEVAWLVGLLRKRGVAIVHVNTSSLIGPLIAARLCHVPVVCHLREIRVSPRCVGRALATTISLLADHVITTSRAVAAFARSGWAIPRSLEIVHDGLGTVSCSPPSRPDGASLGVPTDRPVVSVIGRITYWKGTHVFVEAARRLLSEFPETYFLIVGDSDTKQAARYHRQLENAVQKSGVSGHILFTGFVTDVRPVLARTDILVLPSIYPEPFGMVVIEAMREGKPVIATSHGGPLDIVEDGKNGFLVRPNDSAQLADRIAFLLRHPHLREHMGARARRRISRDFQLSQTMTSIHRTYERMVG